MASQQLSLMRRESDLLASRCSPPPAQAAITKTRAERRRKYAATRNRFFLGVHAADLQGDRGSLCLRQNRLPFRGVQLRLPDWIAKWKRRGGMRRAGVQLLSTVCI